MLMMSWQVFIFLSSSISWSRSHTCSSGTRSQVGLLPVGWPELRSLEFWNHPACPCQSSPSRLFADQRRSILSSTSIHSTSSPSERCSSLPPPSSSSPPCQRRHVLHYGKPLKLEFGLKVQLTKNNTNFSILILYTHQYWSSHCLMITNGLYHWF